MDQKEKVIRAAYEYKSVLEAYAYTVTKDWNLAEDAVQEVFIQVSLKWEDLDEKRLLSWMKVVARNKSVDILRKRKRHVYDDDLAELVDGYFMKYLNDELRSISADRRYHLKSCLRELNHNALYSMMGFYRDGKNTEELGHDLSRSANSVRILLHRTRDTLRRCINAAIDVEAKG